MKQKLKPCDCKDIATARKLKEQGIGHNDQRILVEPNVVVLTMGHTTIRIPMIRFKMFAKWYLEEQDIDETVTMNQALRKPSVDERSKLLLDFANELNEEAGFPLDSEGFEEFVNKFLNKQ